MDDLLSSFLQKKKACTKFDIPKSQTMSRINSRSSIRSVSHSVTDRARQNRAANGGGGIAAANNLFKAPAAPQRFMSLEEECNWILSGREPLMYNDNNGFDNDDDDEDNTLDDISGDEVLRSDDERVAENINL